MDTPLPSGGAEDAHSESDMNRDTPEEQQGQEPVLPSVAVHHPEAEDDSSTSFEGSSSYGQHVAQKSLWSQLLGGENGDSSSEEDNDEDDSAGTDEGGVRLLGQHLARVKLQAEEREYQFKMQIEKLLDEKQEQQAVLREALSKSAQLEAQVKQLEVQNSRKWQIETRDHWINQIESVKQERNRLRAENEQMSESLQKLQAEYPVVTNGDDDNDVERREQLAPPGLSSTSTQADSLKSHLAQTVAELAKERAAREDLQREVDSVKQQLEESGKACLALKKKLDFELELKWERSRQTAMDEQAENGSVLDSLVQVVAPRY